MDCTGCPQLDEKGKRHMKRCLEALDNPEFDPTVYRCWQMPTSAELRAARTERLFDFIALWKHRCEQAASFVSLPLLIGMFVMTLNNKFSHQFNALTLYIAGVGGFLIFAYLVDKFFRAGHRANKQSLDRNDEWQVVRAQLDRLEKMVEKK